MKSTPLKCTALIGLCCLLPAATQADVLASDSFDYSPYGEGYSIDGKNGGTGWNDAWTSGTNGTTYLWGVDMNSAKPAGYNYAVNMPAVRLLSNGNATIDARRNLSSGIDLGSSTQSVYYFSYLWARTDSSTTNGYEASYLSLRTASGEQLINVGVDGNEQLKVELTGTATGGSAVSQVDTSQTLTVTGDIATTGRYLIVGKITVNADGTNDMFNLSVFDGSDTITGEPESWNITLSADTSGTIGQTVMTVQKWGGATYWDNLVVGTDFESVTAVPEPATVGMLMALGGLALAASRGVRRRNR